MLLDDSGHGPGAHVNIVAFLHQPQTCILIHIQGDPLLVQLALQFRQEFVHHCEDNVLSQRLELDDAIQAVAEFRAEHLANRFHAIRAVVLGGETNSATADGLCTGIGRHYQDNIAEVRLAPVVVRERTVIHHLQ